MSGGASNRSAALVVAAWTLTACASTPPEEDPVQIKLKDLDSRLARIERVVANQSLLDLSNQIEALRSDVRTLHNDVDVSNHNLEATHKQQHDLYADLDQRLKTLEGRGGAGGTGAAAAAATAASGATPSGTSGASLTGTQPSASGVGAAEGADKTSYQAAFDRLKDGQYDRAIVAFEGFLASYPNSPLADNAQYWLGEAFYVNKSFAEALTAFNRVVSNYPGSRKLPDALLKVGYCDYELKQFPAARDALSKVTAKFPDSPSGRLAQQRLEKMAAENN